MFTSVADLNYSVTLHPDDHFAHSEHAILFRYGDSAHALQNPQLGGGFLLCKDRFKFPRHESEGINSCREDMLKSRLYHTRGETEKER